MTESVRVAKPIGLHVDRRNMGEPPLVLLHGVTRRGDDWRIVEHYLTRWGLHALDQRGHGRSDWAPGAYRVADFVEDTVRHVLELDQPAVIFGHSLGAMVACGVAARVPNKVRALVLEDPTFEMTGARIAETSFSDTFQAYLPHVGSRDPIGTVARALGAASIRVPGTNRTVSLGSIRDAASLSYTASCLRRLDPTLLPLILAGRWLEGYPVNDTLSAIECPTLFVQADPGCGGALPDEYARELASQIPGAIHVKLPGTGHNIHTTQPEALMRVVMPFLCTVSDS